MARILIVDDERSMRRTLGQFLREAGYEAIEAEDADTAFKALQEGEFDVVVTGIILPRVTGVELLRRIHATAPYVQVVMMTGEPTIETASESLREGAADYLFKPITKAAILRVVANAVKLKTLDDSKRGLEMENRAHRENLERLVDERTRQLRASEERACGLSGFNQGVLDALSAHICVLAENGTILAVNESWRAFARANLPLPSNAHAGANYLTVCESVIGEDTAAAQEVVQGLRTVARGDLPEFSLEYACHSPDTQRWFIMRATRFAGPGPVRIVVAHVNITARKLAEGALREKEREYRGLIENLIAGIVVHAPDTSVMLSNPMASRLLGLTDEQMRGKTALDPAWRLLREDGSSTPLADYPVNRVVSSGRPIQNQVVGIHRSDLADPTWVLCNAYPLHDASGRLSQAIVTFVDITERKLAEEALRVAHERLRRFVDSNVVGIVIVSAAGNILESNDYFLRVVGLSRKELEQGKVDWRAITPPEWLPRDENAIRELRERGICTTYEKEYIRRDGVRVPVLLATAMLPGLGEQIAAFVLCSRPDRAQAGRGTSAGAGVAA